MSLDNDGLELDANKRQAILLLEAAALLHDYGKLSDGFLANTAADKPRHATYQEIGRVRVDPAILAIDTQPLPEKSARRKAIEAIQQAHEDTAIGAPFKDLEAAGRNVTDLLAAHTLQDWTGQEYNLAEVLALAGQWAARVDWLGVLGKAMQPATLIGRLHGAAHYEKPNVHTSNIPPLHQVYRATPFGLESKPGNLTEALAQLPFDRLGEMLTDERPKLLNDLRALLRQGLADTRRASNEVSLWDWGYVVASLLKPAAYTLFRRPETNPEALAFRPLAIRADRLERYSRSDRVTDMLGVRDELDRAFVAARRLLEETYALGNRFYHDETGEYYLVPDLGQQGQEALRRAVVALFPPDLAPGVVFHEPVQLAELDPPRGTPHKKREATSRRLLAEPRNDRRPAVPDEATLTALAASWNDGRPANAELCSVCRMRPIGSAAHTGGQALPAWATAGKARERKVCRVCLGRRGRRAEAWLAKGIDGPTIWTDEVADDSGRLALFVGRLGLDDWLDGDHFHTLPDDRTQPTIGRLPTPTRLYRVAETARAFWQEVSEALVAGVVGRAPARLAIQPATDPGLGHGHAYELSFDGLEMAVVWDDVNKRFLTTENLAYFVSRWRPREGTLTDRLAGRLTVVEPSAFLRRSKEGADLSGQAVATAGTFAPYIPLLAEPSVCMLLVPAAQALALCDKVADKHRDEMGRVADRLPLSLGLVFFERRAPMSAVLDAGRRLLDRVAQPEQWAVAAAAQDGDTTTLTLTRDDRRISYTYPALLAEGTHDKDGQPIDDRYYPYLYTALAEGDTDATTRHVSALHAGDGVHIWPGTFDFEYLDTTGRRFEIAYDHTHGRRLSRPTRPFLLADFKRLEALWADMATLKTAQQYQIIQRIEATREAWFGSDTGGGGDEVFATFVADTLAVANWRDGRRPAERRDDLNTAGVSGELADLAELHLEILKAEPANPSEQEEQPHDNL